MTDSPNLNPGHKTIYEASTAEVFGKNFVAGMAHALGAVIIQLCFLLLLAYISFRYFMPEIQPILDMMNRSVSAMEQLQGGMMIEESGTVQTAPGSNSTTNPQMMQLQQLLNQYQNQTR